MNSRKCSLRNVAQACGVSVATVSMALRDMGRVPLSTREKIKKAAVKLGYVRDVEMSRLMSRARRPEPSSPHEELVFLTEIPIGSEPDPAFPWLHPVFHRTRDTAHLLGYELNPVVIPSDLPTQKKISKALWARGIRGIIVSPITQSENASLSLEWKHFACVEIGATIQNVNLHRVERGFYDDLLELYETLHAQGYRRIGIALTESRLKFMRQMPEATLLFFQSRHPEMQSVKPMRDFTQDGLQHWLEEQKPDVIMIYEPVSDWLDALKIRVPRDLGVVYLHSTKKSQTGLLPDVNLLCKEAVHLLIRMVEGGEWGLPSRPRSHRFRNIFNLGRTTRCLPSAASQSG